MKKTYITPDIRLFPINTGCIMLVESRLGQQVESGSGAAKNNSYTFDYNDEEGE